MWGQTDIEAVGGEGRGRGGEGTGRGRGGEGEGRGGEGRGWGGGGAIARVGSYTFNCYLRESRLSWIVGGATLLYYDSFCLPPSLVYLSETE